MITKEKLDKLHIIIDRMTDNDEKTKAIKLLLSHVDNLFDEVIWLKEQNEDLRFALEDKKIEQRSPRLNTVPAQFNYRLDRFIDEDLSF